MNTLIQNPRSGSNSQPVILGQPANNTPLILNTTTGQLTQSPVSNFQIPASQSTNFPSNFPTEENTSKFFIPRKTPEKQQSGNVDRTLTTSDPSQKSDLIKVEKIDQSSTVQIGVKEGADTEDPDKCYETLKHLGKV